MMKLLAGIFCAGLLLPCAVLAQKRVSFEKVTLEELQMSSYANDSSAGAVILMDLGYLNGNELKFYRKMRIKILTKAGLDWGNRSFNTPTKGDFRVVTHNLVDGKIVSEKADSKSIHEEEVIEGIEIYKVFAPNVKVGSVVDITYSHFGPPLEWRFQERIPIAYSELTLEDTDFLKFNKTHFGLQPIETVSRNQWRSKNMPAFITEPFISTYANYITKFEFQLESIGTPGRNYYEFSTTWRRVVDILLDHPRFGGVIKGSAFLNDFAKETKVKSISVKEKIQAAYTYVQSNMKWNGRNTILATAGLRNNFLVDHSGSSAEINLVLVCLLNKMDITAYPVVLSTRENGFLVPFSPTIDKLDYVVCMVQHEDLTMFVDATMPDVGAPGMVPVRCLNGNGLMIKKDNEQWFGLNKGYNDVKKQFISITIEKGGVARGKLTQDYAGYGYINWTEELKASNNDADIIKNKLQKENQDIKIEKYEIAKRDANTSTGKEVLELDMSGQLIDAGGDLIFTPFAMHDYLSNPLKSETRKYPVDLTYPRDLQTTIVIQLPKEYAVKTLPEGTKLSTPDGGATFTYLASASGSTVQFRVVLKITKHIWTESEYADLRMFFGEVSKKISAPIELAKT